MNCFWRYSVLSLALRWIARFVVLTCALRQVRIVQRVQELKKVAIVDKKVELETLKYFHFQLNKFHVVNSTSNLKRFVVVVHFIMKFRGQNQRRKQQFMNVEPCECKIGAVEVVPIDVNEGQNQALRFKASFLMNAVNVDAEVDIFEKWGVEIGLRSLLVFLVFDEVSEEWGGQ